MRTEATDPEERALTADGATVRLRDKHVARTAAAAMVPGALLFLLATVAVALGADPAAPRIAALLPFAAFALLTWSLVGDEREAVQTAPRSRCAGWWSTATASATSSARAASRRGEVRFRVQQREVGDFLATLAVMERGGSSVRAAAFPMPEEREASEPAPERAARCASRSTAPTTTSGWATPSRRPSGARRTASCSGVTPAGAGLGHRAEPLGRRLADVSLSLVAGAPVSFRSELARR
jgi:hypothetical protein